MLAPLLPPCLLWLKQGDGKDATLASESKQALEAAAGDILKREAQVA